MVRETPADFPLTVKATFRTMAQFELLKLVSMFKLNKEAR